MKKFFLAAMVCVALVGCKDKGNDFIGQWKNSDNISETITVSKVGDGYRAISKLDNPDMAFMNMDVKMVAESDRKLVNSAQSDNYLELSSDGTITSKLRSKQKTFTRVN
ncbi:hypothetical protein [Pseudomonas syringae pv. coryli]|uniref:hypothetical protein n=1 Tax=Pseudomonas syringae pv. coryli TaxID=317659 RepID=UPI003D285E9C